MSFPRRLLASAATIVALTTGLVSFPSGASASPYSARTALLLTVAQGEESGSVSRAAVLTCNPAGGSHPDAVQACTVLTAVAGDVAALTDESGACTLIYDPVTVAVRGLWQGQEKVFRATYPNSCVLRRQTHDIFDF